MSRELYAEGLVLLADTQRKLEYPPKRKLIKSLVDEIVKKSGLRNDVRERYFRLLATCALLAKEPMYNSFKPRKRRVNEEERKEAHARQKESIKNEVGISRNKESKHSKKHHKKESFRKRHSHSERE